MTERHLAFDLGASGGRAMLGSFGDDGLLSVEEVHRFHNAMVEVRGRLFWDVLGLLREILGGTALCARGFPGPVRSIGVDTWGVDFGLLDGSGELAGPPVAYRDPRTQGAMEEVLGILPAERIYDITGIQFLPFNTLYQLRAAARRRDPALAEAEDLLFMPDLFAYLLCGEKGTEYTVASTSQMLDARTRDWAPEILEALGIPAGLLGKPVPPGTVRGPLKGEIAGETGLGPCDVVAPASHDTASAVAAVPASGGDFAYVSVGTWSLVGVESRVPFISEKARGFNVTNEGGVEGTYRVLKNVMGLWILQECRKAWSGGGELEWENLLAEAEGSGPFPFVLDPDQPAFLNPPDMPGAIRDFCGRTGQDFPGVRGAVTRAVLEGLALAARRTLEQIEELRGARIDRIHLIGGGSRNELLCRFTADATGRPVIAGPAEATAVGNLLVQAMAAGRLSSLEEARAVVRRSFATRVYEPALSEAWERPYERFKALKGG